MKCFIIPTIGTGSEADPIRPNLSLDTAFVGQPFTDNTYLVAVPDASPITPGPGIVPIPPQSLAAEAARRGLAHADVLTWHVGPPSVPPGQGQVPATGQGNGRA